MEKERKAELLKQIESLNKKLENYSSRGFCGFLASSSKTYYLQKRSIESYFKFLCYSQLQTKQIITGGKSSEEGYKRFLKEELRIIECGEIITIGDAKFAKMNMEEIAFVLGWLRRLAPENEEKKGVNNKAYYRENSSYNNRSKSNSYNKQNGQEKNKREKNYSGDEYSEGNVFSDFFGRK